MSLASSASLAGRSHGDSLPPAHLHPHPPAADAELLREEGADLPHRTRAGNVELPGAGES